MKDWKEITATAQKGDWQRVASILGCSRKTVEKIAAGERTDSWNAQAAFSEMLEDRESLTQKYNRDLNGISESVTSNIIPA